MAGQFIPLPGLEPIVPTNLTREQCIAEWFEWFGFCDALMQAGLRRKIGPNGDMPAAYRAWYADQMLEHDRAIARMLTELNRRSPANAP